MQLDMWDLVVNVFTFVFWLGIWPSWDVASAWNPYLHSTERLTWSMVDFLRPVLFRAPRRIAAIVAVLFLLAFRAVMFRSVSLSMKVPWTIQFGFLEASVQQEGMPSFLAFSVVSFAVFLFYLWGLTTLYVHGYEEMDVSGNAAETLFYVSRPLTGLPMAARIVALLVFGVLILNALDLSSSPGGATTLREDPTRAMLQYVVSTAAAGVNCLGILLHTLMFLIIGSWLALLTGGQNLATFCREWIDLIMGPLRRYPIAIGAIDLSPIIFYMAVQLVVYPLLTTLLFLAHKAVS